MMCRIVFVGFVAAFLAVGCSESPLAPDAEPAATKSSFSRGVSVVRPWKGQATGYSLLGDACGGPGQALEAVPGVITAANGDEINIVLVGFESDPATGAMFSRWSLDGGTGRFADAIGEYKACGVNYPDFTWENTSAGWIQY